RCRTQQRIGAGPAGARADRSVPARFVDRARRRTHLANAPASATPVPAVRRHRGHARRTPGGTGRHAVGAECARAPLGAALCRPSGARAGSGAVTAARGQRSPAARRGGTRRRRSRRDRPGAARRTGSGARPRRARPRGIGPRASRVTLTELRVATLPEQAKDPARLAPEQFLNAELSWLEFNARVLELAEDPRTPLAARLRFLSIFATNLDQFVMTQIGALKQL